MKPFQVLATALFAASVIALPISAFADSTPAGTDTKSAPAMHTAPDGGKVQTQTPKQGATQSSGTTKPSTTETHSKGAS